MRRRLSSEQWFSNTIASQNEGFSLSRFQFFFLRTMSLRAYPKDAWSLYFPAKEMMVKWQVLGQFDSWSTNQYVGFLKKGNSNNIQGTFAVVLFLLDHSLLFLSSNLHNFIVSLRLPFLASSKNCCIGGYLRQCFSRKKRTAVCSHGTIDTMVKSFIYFIRSIFFTVA